MKIKMDINKTCYLFFDFDGTITVDIVVTLADGSKTLSRVLPKEHLRAIRAAHDAGHKIFLCTGRSRGSVMALGTEWRVALDLPWDGMIFGATDMWYGGDRIDVKYISRDECLFWLDYCRQTRRAFRYNGTEAPIRYDFGCELTDEEMEKIIADIDRQLKINPLTNFSTVPEATDIDLSKTDLTVINLPTYSDIFPKGCNKGTAIMRFCKLIGAPLEQTVCFGDSANDVDMMKACNYGVAMKSAPSELKAVASYSAESDYGVAEAIKHIFEIE